MSIFLTLIGCALCIVSSFLSADGSDKAIWFFALGIYVLGKADYLKLKDR